MSKIPMCLYFGNCITTTRSRSIESNQLIISNFSEPNFQNTHIETKPQVFQFTQSVIYLPSCLHCIHCAQYNEYLQTSLSHT